MHMQRLSPVIFVPEIEACLPFWTERLGYELHASVEEGDRLGFALLLKDEVQLMYQSRASLAKDLPQLEERDHETSTCLYINVDDIDAVEKALSGLDLVQPRRKTFYGAVEIAVREPGGNLVIFSQRD